MSLDETVGGPEANSYVGLDEADAYFANRMNAAAWTVALQAAKEAALVTATQRLDIERYVGVKATREQALKWPRTGAMDEDGLFLDADTIPRAVKVATYEMAIYLLSKGTVDTLLPTGLEAFKSLKAPGAEIVLNTDRTPAEQSGLPTTVVLALGTLLTTHDPVAADPSPGIFRIKRA